MEAHLHTVPSNPFQWTVPPPLFLKRISTPKGNHCVQHPKMLRIPLIPLNFVCVCVCYAWLNVFFYFGSGESDAEIPRKHWELDVPLLHETQVNT